MKRIISIKDITTSWFDITWLLLDEVLSVGIIPESRFQKCILQIKTTRLILSKRDNVKKFVIIIVG